jgi:hypothetical protein
MIKYVNYLLLLNVKRNEVKLVFSFVKGDRTLIYVKQNKTFVQLIVIHHHFHKSILFFIIL